MLQADVHRARKDLKRGIGREELRIKHDAVGLQLSQLSKLGKPPQPKPAVGDLEQAFADKDRFPAPGIKYKPAKNDQDRVKFLLGEMGVYLRWVNSSEVKLQLEGVEKFRRMLSLESHPPINEVIQQDVIPRFVEFLGREDNTLLQYEAAWALTNIASGTTYHVERVISAGAVPLFVHLLKSTNEDVREQAVWALGNVAGDNTSCRDVVLDAGALPLLLDILRLENPKLSLQRNATWAVLNCCRGKPKPWLKVHEALPVLKTLIESTDSEVQCDACWALAHLSDGPNEHIQEVVDLGVCSRIVELLRTNQGALVTPALRTLGNIATGDDVQTQAVVDAGALPALKELLTTFVKRDIAKEACWAISNITAGTTAQIQAVIDAGLLPVIIEKLQSGDGPVGKEAGWALNNAASTATPAQVEALVQGGCVGPICSLLSWTHTTAVVLGAVEALKHILEAGQEMRATHGGVNPYALKVHEAEGDQLLRALLNLNTTTLPEKAGEVLDAFFAEGAESWREGLSSDTLQVTDVVDSV